MGKLSILVVAPEHPDLPNVAAEVAAIGLHHETVQLTGMVRDSDVARAIDEGPYEVIWFASHGTAQGIRLSDGLLSMAGVGQYVRTAEAKLCVLNTCESELVALGLVGSTDADTICTITDVADRDASRLAILLARELARVDDFYEAYLQVRPSGGNYRYYRAGLRSPRHQMADEVEAQIRRDLERLIMLIDGSPDLGVRGIRNRVRDLVWRTTALMFLVGLEGVLLIAVLVALYSRG